MIGVDIMLKNGGELVAITTSEAKDELSTLLDKGRLCVFAGSGVSVDTPSELPTWDGFVSKYIEICKRINDMASDDLKFNEIISDAEYNSELDAINTITALKDRIKHWKDKSGLSLDRYTQKLNDIFATDNFNEYHDAIVNTNYSHILTTNYDTLLDEAAECGGYVDLCKRIYTYTEADKISSAIYQRESALIHVHGIRSRIAFDEFVLTRDDYKRIKDKNPGFRTIMNNLFMNYSMLLVGYGGSDPHMEDVIEDINLSLGWLDSELGLGSLPTYYIILHKDKVSPIVDHIKYRNRTKIIPVEKYSESLELLKYLATKHPRSK